MEGWESSRELLSEHFPGIVWVYQVHPGHLSYINHKVCDLLGYGPGEVSRWKDDWKELFYPEDRELASRELVSCLKLGPGEYRTFDCRLIHRHDRWKHFRIQGSVLHRDRDRNPASLLFFAQEVAPPVRAVDTKEIEEFAYAASHDLQEPLRKIIAFGDRLRQKCREALGSEGQAYLSRMTGATEHMRRLIDSLLEFSRVTRNREEYALTDLNELLEEVTCEIREPIGETGAGIEHNHLPLIECDGAQVKQLFLQILSNSLKFRDPGRAPRIEVRSDPVPWGERARLNLPAGPEFHQISFRDNGIGFDQAHAEQIFVIFQRLNGKSEFPGSGVGLAICKKIAGQHGGTIRAESTPGGGALFSVFLPATQAFQ